jgi:hypothetical protein
MNLMEVIEVFRSWVEAPLHKHVHPLPDGGSSRSGEKPTTNGSARSRCRARGRFGKRPCCRYRRRRGVEDAEGEWPSWVELADSLKGRA